MRRDVPSVASSSDEASSSTSEASDSSYLNMCQLKAVTKNLVIERLMLDGLLGEDRLQSH